ncbi:Tetratricopeptide repeat [Plasmodiophora brassicae]
MAATVPVDTIRALVQSCEAAGCIGSGLFFADKLVSFRNDDSDVYALAKLLFAKREFRRAVHVLSQSEAMRTNIRFRLLAGRCLMEVGDFDGALAVVGDDDEDGVAMDRHEDSATELSVQSAVCFLRGCIFEALENRHRSVYWFKQAVLQDVRCYDAFSRIVQERMLPLEEELAFFQQLVFPPGYEWLRDLYACEISQHSHEKDAVSEHAAAAASIGLHDNSNVLACQAQHAYNCNQFQAAHDLSQRIMEKDPYHDGVLPVYLCSLVELKRKSDLFYCAHQLVESYPNKAIAWFAVACYYYLIGKYDIARRYFSKSTSVDGHFVSSWVGFGHAFGAQDECDQAMSAYRTAERLFKGSHVPLLCLGIEFMRTNNLKGAMSLFEQSLNACPTDPMVYNEIAVAHYRNGAYVEAIEGFTKALSLVPPDAVSPWEPTLFNLGHALRKIGEIAKAREYYLRAQAVNPRNASVHTAIGLTYHLEGDRHAAIDQYHKALGLLPRNTLTNDLLTRCIAEVVDDCKLIA